MSLLILLRIARFVYKGFGKEPKILLFHNLINENKVIILTGSMVPLESFAGSDALFNLGFSIAKIFHLEPGVYVCMNGRIFDPDEIAKLIGKGKFVSIFNLGKNNS